MARITTKGPRSAWPFFGFLAGCGLWAVSALANYKAGVALSPDEGMQYILGGASLSADLMKVAALFALFAACSNRRFEVALMAGLLFALCSIWSMRAGAVFVADILAANGARIAHARAISEQRHDLLDVKKTRAGFLSQQNLKTDVKSRPMRDALISENKRVASEFTALTTDIEGEIQKLSSSPPTHGDSFAQMIRDVFPELFTGKNQNEAERSTWIVTAAFFALLVEIGSGCGFWIISHSRQPRRKIAPAADMAQSPGASKQATEPAPLAMAPQNQTDSKTPPAGNVVDLRGNPLPQPIPQTQYAIQPSWDVTQLLSGLFVENKSGRVLLSDVAALVNGALPRSKKLTTPHKVSTILVPALMGMGWDIQKVKIGGKMYIVGMDERSKVLLQARQQ